MIKREESLPQRRGTRFKHHNYSAPGAYFVTVCIKNRAPILSELVGGGDLDAPRTELTPVGETVERILCECEKIPGVRIDEYVWMPDHVHVIIFLDPLTEGGGGTSRAPSPTNERLSRVIGVWKRFCAKEIGNNPFQRGFYDHVIRDRADYDEQRKYILENPARRFFKTTDG